MSRKPGYLEKLPPDLAEDPFWSAFHKPPPPSFGIASRRLSSKDLRLDHEYHLKKEINQWDHVDTHLVRHGRLQIESRWGTVASASPGDYEPDADKRSKMPSFPSTIITRREPDKYMDDLHLARTQPIHTFRVATANAEKRQQVLRKQLITGQGKKGSSKNVLSGTKDSVTESILNTMLKKKKARNSGLATVTTGPATKSEFKEINLDDMRNALMPAPGQYSTDMYHTLNFDKTAMPLLRPKDNIGKPRAKIDFETLERVEDENQLFDGSYFQYEDPTKKQLPSYTLGVRRPISDKEHVRVGPGDYNDPTVTGATSVLSSTNTLKLKPGLSSSLMRSGLSSHSFGRKTLIK